MPELKATSRIFPIVLATAVFTFALTLSLTTPNQQHRLYPQIYVNTIPNTTAAPIPVVAAIPQNPTEASNPKLLKRLPHIWLSHLRKTAPNGRPTTNRIGCREYDAGAQSCVYEGFICVNTSSDHPFGRPTVYMLDDTRPDNTRLPSDDWCSYRAQSSDPRYYSSRHWPIRNGTHAPQRTCLDAYYRTAASLLGARLKKSAAANIDPNDPHALEELLNTSSIKWLPSIWLVDLDYVDNNHNNHLVKEIIWILDVALWQDSLSLRPRPGYHRNNSEKYADTAAHLFDEGPQHLYLPQGESDFVKQTSRDVNRLTYSLILQLNLEHLYPNFTAQQMHTPSDTMRPALPLLEAFPHLKAEDSLLFHRDILKDPSTDLVCAPRFTAGAKIGNGAHERVCRSIRQRAHAFYGIPTPPLRRLGQILYPQPPKRIVILQRHVTRGIVNLDQLEKRLRRVFEKEHGVEVEIVSTANLRTAEEFVRVFARAGVLLTSHGSQSMGQIFMPRHSSIIEVMPVGYTDYAFNLLSESCKIWYYELQSMLHPNKTKEYYIKECGNKVPHQMNPCTTVKSVSVSVDLDEAEKVIRFALERMGYAFEPWFKYVKKAK